MEYPDISLVLAIDSNFGISKNGKIPWYIKEYCKYFLDITNKPYKVGFPNAIIMGRLTYQILNPSFKNCLIVVVSQSLINNIPDIHVATTLKNAIKLTQKFKVGHVFICGGKKLYEEAYEKYNPITIYLTKIDHNYECDNIINFSKLEKYNISNSYTIKLHNHNVTFTKMCHIHSLRKCKTNPQEQTYLDLMYNILTTGDIKQTRNGKTISKFASTLEFNLSQGFPLLTTKKMFMKGIFEELLFFLKGQTNSKILTEKGVKIWESNTSRSFLDACGLNYEEGDMGPLYGFQLRHFNAVYQGCNFDYGDQGIDQISYCLHLIKTDPFSRRIVMTTLNPSQVQQGCLWPCHSLILQFHVSNDYKLSLSCYNRSQDMFLGVPFNIASAALLVLMFIEVINNTYNGPKLTPGRLIINMGDVHIYEEHQSLAIRQILREPFEFPQLKLNGSRNDLTDFIFEDLEIIGYNCYSGIIAKMIA